jgi:DNA-directed RNA polymerase specialized sigma24 family protein
VTTKARSLEDQIRRTINFWCWRLNNHRRADDLAQSCWLRIIRPETWTKLETIWQDSDPELGNIRGLSKYLAAVCASVYNDWCREQNAQSRIPSKLIASLNEPIFADPDGPESNETLADTISNDHGGEYQAFVMADLRDGLTPEEFRVVDEIVAGYSVRELAARYDYSKSTAVRIQAAVIAKVKKQIDQLQQKPRPATVAIPLCGRATYQPDRISPENLMAWRAAPTVVPFFPCRHAEASGVNVYQNFRLEGAKQGPGRFAVCGECWSVYWHKLSEALEIEILRLADWIGAAALGQPKNN